ncbi:hypothetical protein MXD59_11930 [Frankia sp. Ag45/Mut15]|uniref:Uncharacterized protein n=1 Tax=Frankia umida TaxID=573489 RepID=A0ABT0JY54_9ACTN|nr:hypothetical protein [Frankia umida]MCK9876473.1 hypothetical protein [Frankia umida]
MPSAGLAWQTLSDPGALALVDAESGRAAALGRPHPADLPMVQIVDLERLAGAWLAPASRTRSEQHLYEQAHADPEHTLRGLCWLMAMWAVAVHLRTGCQPTAVVESLRVSGIWRGVEAPECERVWEELAERIRLGVLAELTGDPGATARFGECVRRPSGIAVILLDHTLRMVSDLHALMLNHDIDPREMAGTLALYTVDPQDPATACFRPLT